MVITKPLIKVRVCADSLVVVVELVVVGLIDRETQVDIHINRDRW